MGERIFVNLYRDWSKSLFLKVTISNKRTINSIYSHFSINSTKVTEIQKIDEYNSYFLMHKIIKRNTKYNLPECLLKNDCSKIGTHVLKQAIKHFDSLIVFPNDNKSSKTSLYLKIGKRLMQKNVNSRIVASQDQEDYALMCFQDFKVVDSIRDYLPLVYYSNSVRYKEILKNTADKISSLYESAKKEVSTDAEIINAIQEFRGRYDSLNKEYKSFIQNKDNLSYQKCVDFNNKCLELQRVADDLSFILSFYSKNEQQTKEDDFAIRFSRNDCVFYRGITNLKFNCLPKMYRELRHYLLEDTIYREYKMRFPEKFEGKTAIESITMMQHFGCSTRLLDITTNPLVALFMCCFDGFSKEDHSKSLGEIIIFFPRYKNGDNEIKYYDSLRVSLISAFTRLDYKEKQALRRIVRRPSFNRLTIKEFIENYDKTPQNYPEIVKTAKDALEHLISVLKHEQNFDCSDVSFSDLEKSYYVKTPYNNDRIRAQSGCFILCGLNPNYIDDNFSSSRNNLDFYRIIIKDKKNLLNELQQLNIHQASMLPDMQNVADYFNNNKY